jgi:DNA invertase Pin-like site-specific DNA recombinase
LAVSDDDFLKFLHDLKLNNCSFHTVASVYYEFTGTSDNPDNYNKRVKLFEDLEIVIQPIERKMDEIKEFAYVLRKQTKVDYADLLLCSCLYKMHGSYVLTENHKHFPLTLLDREDIITIDKSSDIRNIAVYSLSQEKFDKAAKKLLG